MGKLELWEQKLKDKGIRWTRQREIIIGVLLDSSRPLSAQDIFAKLKEEYPKLRLSTVYRNLNSFKDDNIVRSLNLKGNEQKFELIDGHHHHHLICIECDDILPLDCPLKEFERKLKDDTGYTIIDHRMKIYGLCPSCKKY
ncbi:transcriptional repressor [Orenia metallireducens]|jgi:Fe2+ or Zn2+ uptake regulation protein|uniref:Transcriptional repressor n=1 Tax=Orenia metallireducens TaxID=1413210 RepID=A0A1C0ACB8_9FIRM|nr:Fur family transcriptional regulator [Orenia metallireducens]OCL28021.1 transcriptional repressor [Orenia metallireducens]